jgi:hypothetical protein
MSTILKKVNKPVKMSSLPIIENIEKFDDPYYWLGYKIIISDYTKNITCKIENSRNCCEKWGVYTKSNLNTFIGAEYYSIDISEIKSQKYEDMKMVDITISTNRGNIIIHLYNEHNRYYSHDVFIESDKGIKNIKV